LLPVFEEEKNFKEVQVKLNERDELRLGHNPVIEKSDTRQYMLVGITLFSEVYSVEKVN